MGDAAYNKLYRVKATTVTICVGILNVGAEADQRNCSFVVEVLHAVRRPCDAPDADY